MKVLISGGTGFLGQSFTRLLSKQGYTLKILSRTPEKVGILFQKLSIETVEGDIRNPATLVHALEGVDVVIQCAQFPGHPIENKKRGHTYWEVDALGTENLVKAATQAQVKHFIYISGAGTKETAKEPWFKAKWYAEQAVRGSGLVYTILRPSWIYGPGDKSLNQIIQMARRLPFLPMIGLGKNRVQPLHIDDIAEIVALSVNYKGSDNRILEVGGPEEMTMKEMMKRALRIAGLKKMIFPIPKVLAKLGAWPLQFLPNPPMTPKAIDFITMDVSIDIKPMLKMHPSIHLKTLEESLKTYFFHNGHSTAPD
ncbi:MAG: complex I NDUFA9 subunit family protein [Deltaproteobacteria bacterium]|nr:complex I NDUFA9 subunit family protein [Deltaproteobacteria bacterium]